MAIRVIHSPAFGALGALAFAAGRSRRRRDDGFSDTQRAITARDIALIRMRTEIATAAQRNVGRSFRTGGAEKRRNQLAAIGSSGLIQGPSGLTAQAELGQMVLTKQAERIGREQTLTDREKKIALAQLDRRQKLLKRQEPNPQEAFEQDIVTDSDTGLKYFKTRNGEYKPLESGSGKKSTDFGKVIDTARKNLIALADERAAMDGRPLSTEQLANLEFTRDEMLDEAEKILMEQEETTALAEVLQEEIKSNRHVSGLIGSQLPPGRMSIDFLDESGKPTGRGGMFGSSLKKGEGRVSFVKPQSVAEKEDPLALPPKSDGEEDVTIDLGKAKPEEVMAQFKAMKPQDRREFVDQLNEAELEVFIQHLPKAQKNAVRRAIKRLEEEQSRSRPSKVRIREMAKRLDRVLFEFGEQPKRKSMKTPMLGGF